MELRGDLGDLNSCDDSTFDLREWFEGWRSAFYTLM